ncbi:MAG: small conductance mechanosensitive channel [Clostridiales bacterium]|jgi:small conductance mechanosensitive channel|nr:small conductance mechanosensitive channel [Clostridiales bacterium]MDN5299868.1 small conductance mechanosensitive channel [Clostridiales bacterium]
MGATVESLKATIMNSGINIVYAFLILFIGFKVVNYIESRTFKTKSLIKVDPTLQSFVRSAFRLGLKAVVIISALSKLGVEPSTFVAMLGAAGLAIGLALQGNFANLGAGVMIITLRPFKVGDYIEGAGQSGVITEIGLFYTRLTTFDNRAIIIPNSDLISSSLVNYSEFSTRRVDLTFGVGYNSDITKVKQTILHVIESNEMILKDPAPFIRLANHGASSLDFKVRVWVNSADYWEVYHTMLEQVKEAFDQAGIEIPFPQMVVHRAEVE